MRMRIEVPLDTPLTMDFFFKNEDGKEVWIHFKYKRLVDFCYLCGMLTHVTCRYSCKSPTKITSGAGITVKHFGPWLQANCQDFFTIFELTEKA